MELKSKKVLQEVHKALFISMPQIYQAPIKHHAICTRLFMSIPFNPYNSLVDLLHPTSFGDQGYGSACSLHVYC